MATAGADRPKRDTYRHGDLRRALVEAGVDLARHGGPDAVVLRAATRRVGVAPNAAYRHFADRDALQRAVCAAAQGELARAMEAEFDALASDVLAADAEPVAAARARLRAIGVGYLRFARTEPGLFRTAFSVPTDLSGSTSPQLAGDTGHPPFELLSGALDELTSLGALPPDRRPGAEFIAWSAVHGLAVLLIDGPLRGVTSTEIGDIERRVLDTVEQGLLPPP
ncbi:MAG TPA: TetR/AcrR family transcriptional regulator [Pseudonocardia sp.]|jgi:AcrR family transcriptional regulator|nr:TetR/AcrR family transcriptional regulator [Pseudonocardia sp.]